MKLTVGIAGTAGIVKHHIQKLHKIHGVTCKWLHSRSLERAKEFARQNGIANPTADLNDILNDDAVDILMICTEPTRHVDIALQGLAAGKHMLLEKPLDVDPAQGEKLLEAAAGSDRVIGVVSQFRFDPVLRRMKERLDKEAEGLPKTASLTMLRNRDEAYYRAGGGWRLEHSSAFNNQGLHWLDVLNWFFGTPQEVRATSRITRPFLQCADMSAALIDYPGDVSVVLNGGVFGAENLKDQFTVLHPKGSLDYQTMKGPQPPAGFKEKLGRKLLGQPVWGSPDADLLLAMHEDFIHAVREGGSPACTLADGLAALRLAHAIDRAV